MSTLREFVTKALLTKRIGFGDLRRLQRDILPDGITTREEAEVLIALDQAIERIDKAWTEALVSRVIRFVVWASDPPGTVDEEASAWLLAALSCGRSKTALAIAREVVREAYDVDDALLGFGTSSPASRAAPPDRPAASLAC